MSIEQEQGTRWVLEGVSHASFTVSKPRTTPGEIIQGLLADLLDRYHTMSCGDFGIDAAIADQRIAALELAEAAIRHSMAGTVPPFAQVVVLGPTQAGKSTIVNALLDRNVAGVSPLAGHTMHPQGFQVGAERVDDRWLETLFPGRTRCAAAELDRESLATFALESVEVGEDAAGPLASCVVWDTPDFDSLDAGNYRGGVLEAAALADMIVLVVSKEKYSDLSVWRLLALLEPLQRPTLICVNKLTADAGDLILRSLRERLAAQCPSMRDVPLVELAYLPDDATKLSDAAPEALERMRSWIGERRAAPRKIRRAGVARLLRHHWAEWSAPIEAEQQALESWNTLLSASLEAMVESYRVEFLEHPQRFDSFRRATLELLQLLELPGVARALGQVRRFVTWPARQLISGGQAWWRRRSGEGMTAHSDLGNEEIVLFEIVERLLTGLEREVIRRAEARDDGMGVWRALGDRLRSRSADLRQRLQDASREHHQAFSIEIRAAAGRLYEVLQERPALLGTLRAARTTTDIASIVIAVKTGGTPVNDLLFAPAMLAFSSLLTEGALGTYMHRIREDLKDKQVRHIREGLIDGVFRDELKSLARSLEGAGMFGIRIEQLREAEAALDSWEHGSDA